MLKNLTMVLLSIVSFSKIAAASIVNSLLEQEKPNATVMQNTSFSIDLKLSTFNALAPCFADPSYYPENCAQVIANTPYRLKKISSEINALESAGTTVFCFQEITPETYDGISAAFATLFGTGKFQSYVAYHDPSYWLTYQPDPLNPVPNGNATFILTDYWNILTMDSVSTNPTGKGAGNHAVYAKIFPKIGPAHVFHVMNVHLDSDHGGNRKKEIAGAITYLNGHANADETQVLMGDMNSSTSSGSIKEILDAAGMINTKDPLEPTHPFSNGYNSNNNWASIDHIMYKLGTAIAVGDTTVRNHGLWDTYPVLTPDTNNSLRILANFDICGSDHFSVHGTVRYIAKL